MRVNYHYRHPYQSILLVSVIQIVDAVVLMFKGINHKYYICCDLFD